MSYLFILNVILPVPEYWHLLSIDNAIRILAFRQSFLEMHLSGIENNLQYFYTDCEVP